MRVTNMMGVVFVRTAIMFGILGATAAHAAGPPAVNIGSADTLVILAQNSIGNSGSSSIVGDIGLSPGTVGFITGFDLVYTSGPRALSPRVDGFVLDADFQPPTPGNLSIAVGDMQSAYMDASTRTPADFTGLYGGDLTGRKLAPGLYKWNSSVLISAGGVTLAGGPNDVWIFQIAQDLTVAPQGFVSLSGAPKSSNIFWQVAGQTTLGTTSRMRGIVLCATGIVMHSGSSLLGRALTQTSLSLDSSTLLAGASDTIFIDGLE